MRVHLCLNLAPELEVCGTLLDPAAALPDSWVYPDERERHQARFRGSKSVNRLQVSVQSRSEELIHRDRAPARLLGGR